MYSRLSLSRLRLSRNELIVLGFNDTSTVVGDFASSLREREKEIIEIVGDWEKRGTGMKM